MAHLPGTACRATWTPWRCYTPLGKVKCTVVQLTVAIVVFGATAGAESRSSFQQAPALHSLPERLVELAEGIPVADCYETS